MENLHEVVGEDTLLRLVRDEFIWLSIDDSESLSIPESMKQFLVENGKKQWTISNNHPMCRCRLFDKIITIADRNGEIKFPTWGKNRSCPDTSWRKWSRPTLVRMVTSGDTLNGKIEDVDFTGCCKECLETGMWGLSYGDISNHMPDSALPKLACFRGCKNCVRQNGFFWGEYSRSWESRIFLNIPNNGPGKTDVRLGGRNYELIKELSYEDLLSDVFMEMDSAVLVYPLWNWDDLFERLPKLLIGMIREIFPVPQNTITTIDWRGCEMSRYIFNSVHTLDYDSEDSNHMGWDGEQLHGYGLEDQEEEDTEKDVLRKENTSRALQIIEGIMETDDQKLDQGTYLELCRLLRDLHRG